MVACNFLGKSWTRNTDGETSMTPKFIQLLEQCITDGVILGHTRAYKHNDAPSKADINEAIVREVLNELHEWFDFEEPEPYTSPVGHMFGDKR
jgi:hypothetical protein